MTTPPTRPHRPSARSIPRRASVLTRLSWRRTALRLLSVWSFAAALAVALVAGPASTRPALAGPAAAPAAAEQAAAPVTVAATDVTRPAPAGGGSYAPDIIPAPYSGTPPADDGERGGWMQSVLFFSICGAILLLAALAWRDGRRKLRQQGRLDTRART